MKVVCGEDPKARFAGWADEGAQVVVSPEEDVAKFASDLRVADVLLHILGAGTMVLVVGHLAREEHLDTAFRQHGVEPQLERFCTCEP